MKLKTYGSGSSGNCHILTSSTGCSLVLDAGIKHTIILRDYNATKIAGVLVTHKHGDHAAYARKFAENFINVYAPFCAENIIDISGAATEPFAVGEFQIKALPMKHDVPCFGYLIHHQELDGDILYATDTNGIPWKFKKLSLAMIEADYETTLLKKNVANGTTHPFVAQRTKNTHNSLKQAINFILKQVKNVSHVVFVHLSKDNATEELFTHTAKQMTGKDVLIAHEGFELDINKYDIFS